MPAEWSRSRSRHSTLATADGVGPSVVEGEVRSQQKRVIWAYVGNMLLNQAALHYYWFAPTTGEKTNGKSIAGEPNSHLVGTVRSFRISSTVAIAVSNSSSVL